MQFYSFDPKDPIFEIADWSLSFQIITLENIYGLDADHTTIESDEKGWQLRCTRLRWAGGQQHAAGGLTARITREDDDQLRIAIDAQAPHNIRAVKLLMPDLPAFSALDMLDQPRDIPHAGLLDTYPNPLRLPLVCLRFEDGTITGIRAEDAHARAKRFAYYQARFGRDTHTVECIHEQDARWFDTTISVPDWIVARGVQAGDFRAAQLAFNEQAFGLTPYDQRTDIPGWARDIQLCLTLHGMHWSGYVFNTYADMLDIIRFVTERLDGRHVLVYLPGWEGRYYWQYGDFRPDPRLGGAAGFAELCDEARARGVHVMPMFGGNCANAWSPNFHSFGPSSHMKSATRNVFHGNQPDWDMSRARDTGWQAWLNPGAPAWQNALFRQITTLMDTYGFDAVFLDTVEVWTNDPDFNLLEGYRQIVARLHDHRAGTLIVAEDWYDGLLGVFPMFQQTGKWRQVPDWVARYARLIGHITDSEPGRGSTGVFESGYAPYERLPDHAPYIATIAFTDGTLHTAQDEIEAVIAQITQQR